MNDVVVRCEKPKCVKNATHEVTSPFGCVQVCKGHALLLSGDSTPGYVSTSQEAWAAEREWIMAAGRYGPTRGPARRGWLSAVQYVGGIDRFRAMGQILEGRSCEITFSLEPGLGLDDAVAVFELVEADDRVSGAVLSGDGDWSL